MTSRFVCFGELLLRLGAPGREMLLQSPRLDVHVGGAEANVAVALARFGHDARLVSVIADNALGEAAVGEMRRQGVDTTRVTRSEGRMGLYFLATGALQRPSDVLYDRAGSAFERATRNRFDWPALLAGSDWLHVSGVTAALGPDSAGAAIDAVRAARTAGLQVSFDGNFRARLWQRWNSDPAAILHELMAHADIVFADHRDIAIALGWTPPQTDHRAQVQAAARAAFAAFPSLQRMTCTLREQHSVDHHSLAAMLVGRDDSVVFADPREVSPIVDRIGGGDAFAAGVLHGLASGMHDADSLRFGLAAACLKHSVPGDFSPLDAQTITDFVEEGRLDVRR